MSGTIYDKAMFCRNLGLNPDDAYFIRIPSTFPIPNRPIYIKEGYQADTSFVGWNDNFKDIVEKIEKIAGIFHDVKGLIHAPSYEAAEQLYNAIPGNRIVTHTKTNFQEKLSEFYLSKDNKIFISPVCQQGVDFKEDRARFQIILRVPYLNTSDDFVRDKVENDFNWYNYQALIVFGQQLGRPVRSESDYGATFLMDERFNRFISRNSGKIPKWVQQAIIWR
jgi:Rad3-related DNA helicase